MSVAVDTIERMFEHEQMPQPVASPSVVVPTTTRSAADTVHALRSRIKAMQATTLESRALPTHPALAPLLPHGGLRQGAAYSVDRSIALVMTLLAGPSAAGSWCGVVGVPDFGVEAAQRFGIDLDRIALVPQPGDQWLAVTAAVADVMDVVVVRPPKRASDGEVARLSARLRQRGTTLIALGPWPQSEAMLSLSSSTWTGIGAGHGYLEARRATVMVSSRLGGAPRQAQLWMPDPQGHVVTALRGADRPQPASASGAAGQPGGLRSVPLLEEAV